jgi:hypothetical protein
MKFDSCRDVVLDLLRGAEGPGDILGDTYGTKSPQIMKPR